MHLQFRCDLVSDAHIHKRYSLHHLADSDPHLYVSLYHLADSDPHLYVSSGGSSEQHRVLSISVESSGGLQVPPALLKLWTVRIPHTKLPQQPSAIDVPEVYPASGTTRHQCRSVLVLGTCPEKHDLKHTQTV